MNDPGPTLAGLECYTIQRDGADLFVIADRDGNELAYTPVASAVVETEWLWHFVLNAARVFSEAEDA